VSTLGKITTALVIAVIVGAAVAGVRSIPDARRYYKIRQM
jgi:hypothetical protein